MATTEPPDLYTDSSSGLRKTIIDQCDLLGALTTIPMVSTLSLSSGVVLLTMDDIKVLLSLWYLHTCGVESVDMYDKPSIASQAHTLS
jgi:hypothetical protein